MFVLNIEKSTLDLEKGKKGVVGEIREWSGDKYRKKENGKWEKLSKEHNMSYDEHKAKMEHHAEKNG